MKIAGRVVTVFALAALFFIPSVARAGDPTELVRASIDGILEILKDPSLKGEAKTRVRRDKLRERIHERFSFEDMAKRSLGKHWKKRSPEEKKEFVKVFGELIENSYIGKMEGYTDEKVIYDNETIRGKAA